MSYSHIMIPVDLEHVAALSKALDTAQALAQTFSAQTTIVAVTAETPGPVAHTPEEFRHKLEDFAAGQSAKFLNGIDARSYVAHDPTAQIDGILRQAVEEIGADLVVMASHIPNVLDAIWPSHGGKLASHVDVSVFIVR